MELMKSPYKINLALFIIFLLGFLIVFYAGVNKFLFITINTYCALLNPFIWANITFLGDTLTASAIMLLYIRKRPDLVWSGLIASIVAILIVNILKSHFHILRPPAIINKDTINIIGPALFNRSFPSGHTVTIFTLAGILMFYFKSPTVRFSLIFMALLIGISRIAVGVHWPADVLAGAALGSLCAAIGMYSVEKLGWNRMRIMQLVIGFVLIASDFYLLLFYDSKYEQAILLQYFIASIMLVVGIREYYFILLKD
jgi:membrane-associated phospholipid phosphatase